MTTYGTVNVVGLGRVARGFVWAVYISDNPIRRYARLVDADFVEDPTRGWTTLGVADLVPFPQQSRPRRVFGTSAATGRKGSAVVGSTSADLWTGVVNFFIGETNDGELDSYTVTRRRGESIRHFPVGP